MDEPLVSIIILNYNGINDLEKCFESLYNLNYKNVELILVDNKSQDKSVELIKNKYADVKLYELKKNFGFAEGNNKGMVHANGEYVALLNMDTWVDPNWLTELVKAAQSSEKIGIVGSKIYYYYDRKTVNFAGSSCDKYGNTVQIGAKTVENELFNKQEQKKTFFACGASMLFKRELYNKIKLFDPSYFMYFEDVDFCWRAWIFGYDVIYVPTSIIYHKINRIRENFPKIIYMAQRNKLRTILKNYELKSLIKILPNYFYLRLKEIVNSQVYKKSTIFILYLKSFLWNLFQIRSLIRNRIEIQANRKRDDFFIFNLMNDLTSLSKKIKNSYKVDKML